MPTVRIEFHSWLADLLGADRQYSLELEVATGATVRQVLSDLATPGTRPSTSTS